MISLSHAASRRHLGNIVPQVDFLQRSAIGLGALGASGFGAGFGGAVLAVVPADHAEEFVQRWRRSYAESHPVESAEAEFFTTVPSDGISLLERRVVGPLGRPGVRGPVRGEHLPLGMVALHLMHA